MTALLLLRAGINALPRSGGSRPGKTRNKDRQRMNSALMLEYDYFACNAIHTPIEFRLTLQDEQRVVHEDCHSRAGV
jgi:hypothetical protein